MAPPRKSPALADIDGRELADEVNEWVTRHVRDLARDLGGTLALKPRGVLHFAVRRLVTYAQTGELAGDPAHTIECIADALWSTADRRLHPSPVALRVRSRLLPRAIDVVLLAAECRRLLSQRKPVTARHLSALSGVSLRQVSDQTPKGGISAAEAKRWLATHGVKL